MENKKAYFVDNNTDYVYELSASKRKQLEKKHPNWYDYSCEKNYEELNDVFDYFKSHGKLVSCPRWRNAFVGLSV